MSASLDPARADVEGVERRRIDSDERHRMIACAAYYRAERRGFGEEGALADWLEAEREVDAMLSASKILEA